jgi:hypothetical protein
MPTLKNSRRENFARLLASGKTATDAYEKAGYKRSDSNGPALARTPEISGRVAEINGERLAREQKAEAIAAEQCAVTKVSLIDDLREARKRALEANQISAYVNATKEIAILAGVRIERSERGGPGEFDWIDRLNVEELRALAKGELDLEAYRKEGGAVN